MGINDFLPRLPGGDRFLYSFYERRLEGQRVPFDAAGALWQFASRHASDFLRGNHTPALIEWARFLNYIRSICGWKLIVYFDGRKNVEKCFEDERRLDRAAKARDANDLRGQVKNTPEYIAKAVYICKFFRVEHAVSAYEADPQVAHDALARSSTLMTGDSDLLAYGPPDFDSGESPRLGKVILVKAYLSDVHRVIDLAADTEEGEFPLFDLFRKHGRIAFQLYAGCSGCDFTKHRSGIPGIGYARFVHLATQVDGPLTADSLAAIIWDNESELATAADLPSEDHVSLHLQRIVDIYTRGKVYDDSASIIGFDGSVVKRSTPLFKKHVLGDVNSQTLEHFDDSLVQEIRSLDCAQLLHCSVANASTIRGVHLPRNKSVEQCNVSELRDFVAARGGKISLNKPELVETSKSYSFLEAQVPKQYVDRCPDPNGTLYASVSTSCTRSVRSILSELKTTFDSTTDAPAIRDLVADAHRLLELNLFDEKYDNISRVAPELKEGLIYKTFGHIGSSITEKNIGDALTRCWYKKEATYHALAFVPDAHRVMIVSKAIASMKRDEKTRNKTDEGEAPKKQEYLLIMELEYVPTDQHSHGHALGVFTKVLRAYCTSCVAGQGSCRHIAERLWYQYHYWTPDRLGIDRPCTLDKCSWAPGSKALKSDVRMKIHEQQTVKFMPSLKAQNEKTQRGVKRDCTEGIDGNYQLYVSAAKQRHRSGRFTRERCAPLFKLLREQGCPGDEEDVE